MSELLAMLVRMISGAQGHWFDCEPVPKQRVYVANHSSHLDFLVLWAVLPSEVRAKARPVAAKDYWETGKVKRWLAMNIFRAVLVDRKPAAMQGAEQVLAPLLEALDAGDSLILFPEGTRGTGDEVGSFKSGLYHLCKLRAGLEVVPAHLSNLNRILPKGEIVLVPLLSKVHFGAPVRLEDQERKPQFLERTRAAVCALEHA
jgi:1-acyl-sn-glycerol-3-phosphate acyltransferase